MVKESDITLTREAFLSPAYIGRSLYYDSINLPYYKDGTLKLSDAAHYNEEELQHMKACWEGYYRNDKGPWWALWLSTRPEWARESIDWSKVTELSHCTWPLWGRWWKEDSQRLLNGDVTFSKTLQFVDSEESTSIYDFFFRERLRDWKEAFLRLNPEEVAQGHGKHHPLLLLLPSYQEHLKMSDIHAVLRYLSEKMNHKQHHLYEWMIDYIQPITFVHYCVLRCLHDDINNSAKNPYFIKEHVPLLWEKCQSTWASQYEFVMSLGTSQDDVWTRALEVLTMDALMLETSTAAEGILWI